MGNEFNDVGRFHEKFGLPIRNAAERPGREVPEDLLDFRVKFMQEELDEYVEARAAGDHAKMADSLIDLVYVAMGTAHLQNYPWHMLWEEVQRANMDKVRATSETSTERGGTWDVIKPDGWTPPDIEAILEWNRKRAGTTPNLMNLGWSYDPSAGQDL